MADEGTTAHELQCLEHLKRARALGTSIAEYARTHGLKAAVLYDAAKQLRKKGVIADGVRLPELAKSSAEGKPESSDSRFVSVRIERPSAAPYPCSPVLRVQHVRGHVLEFCTWPPAEVMAAALSGGCDDSA
jgi:hypothetical protein